mgnify:CR=1 FL=1
MIINLKEDKPFFETILEYSTHSQHNWAIPFFKNCTRFIINTDEYFSWAGDCDFEKSNGVVDCTIPFDKFWCEFFISHKRSAIRNKLGNFLILGLGFDLEKGSCIALVGNPKEETVDLISFSISKQFEVMTDNPIGIASNICTNIRAIGAYLQTEFVDAYQKSFRSGYKIKRGKLIKLESKYTVIYRKQPNQKLFNKILETSEVEWNYRWRVRGHWRRIEGIGKDPEGNKVQGFTWIKECIKGPENKPLLNKPRIVKDQLPKQFMPMKALG